MRKFPMTTYYDTATRAFQAKLISKG